MAIRLELQSDFQREYYKRKLYTNIEKQTKRHRFPLLGMGGAVGAAAVLFIGFVIWTVAQEDAPATGVPAAVTVEGN